MTINQLQKDYPMFEYSNYSYAIIENVLSIEFELNCGDHKFLPKLSIELPEVKDYDSHELENLILHLGIIETLNYWKAFASPVIKICCVELNEKQVEFWQDFIPSAMGEYFYRNNFSHEQMKIKIESLGKSYNISGKKNGSKKAMLEFSGGKDSSLAYLALKKIAPKDDLLLYLYNPGKESDHGLVNLENNIPVVSVRRKIEPSLIELNSKGYLNGHTPYSAYLAISAQISGLLSGVGVVFAANSRSDDQNNALHHGQEVNHQYTKSAIFEKQYFDYCDSWLPAAPKFMSFLRPMYEIQIINWLLLLAPKELIESFRSCNKGAVAGIDWCLNCSKCAWIFLSFSVLGGRELAMSIVGSDLLRASNMVDVYLAMAGLSGVRPFDCTGTIEEVSACLNYLITNRPNEVHETLIKHNKDFAKNGHNLDELLGSWGKQEILSIYAEKLKREYLDFFKMNHTN